MLKQPHTPSSETAVGSHGAKRRRTAPPPPPEYETERWKHQVEAEARKELKDEIHGVGAHGR